MISSCMIQLTHRCNLRCKMCFYYGEHGSIPNNSKEEMSIDEIIKLVKELKNYNPDIRFILTGGELFVRDDLEELFSFLNHEKIKYNIITNGTITNEKYFNLIAKSDALNFSFSLDGPEKINDNIRGQKEAFNKTIENIKYFQSINEKQIPVTIATTISKNSFKAFPDMIQIANEVHARLTILHLQFLEKDIVDEHLKLTKKVFGKLSDCNRWIADKFSKEEVEIIVKNIKFCKKMSQENKIEIDFLPNLKKSDIYSYYLDGQYHHKNVCEIPFKQIVIDPSGNAYPCFPERFNYSIGNIRKQNIIKLIENDKRKTFLSAMKKHGIFPGCLRCCSLKLNNPESRPKFTYVIES